MPYVGYQDPYRILLPVSPCPQIQLLRSLMWKNKRETVKEEEKEGWRSKMTESVILSQHAPIPLPVLLLQP
ncbi:hypothetical protein M0802_016204 [Mischocyttarus mexicanus]|nr:hypothetical protein M0802_016204 [Mischocyttarus mexicanus]